jgi:hypothetical protein
MYLPPITELSMIGLADAGTPNHERIVIRPTERINLAQFGIVLGYRSEAGLVAPYKDQFFWFGEQEIAPPSWIVVYTGPGKFRQSIENNFGQVYWYYWGRHQTAFNVPEIVPVLFRMTNILIGSRLMPNDPQKKRLT